jgi:hypothetical protein
MQLYAKLVKSILGNDVFTALSKSIVKLNTKSVVDIGELNAALKIAPKSVVAFLMKELSGMEKDGAKEIKVPWDDNSSMLINKLDSDVFKGHFAKDGKIVHEFDLCSIPQLAAHILSLYEMYDETPDSEQQPKEESKKEASIKAPEPTEIESLKTQIKALEQKINALIVLATGLNEPIQKSEPAVKKIQTNELKKKALTKAIRGLKKAGIMPAPPRPGMHAGSQNGITQAGFHGPKTAASDLKVNTREAGGAAGKLASQKAQPKVAKQPKMSFTMKSEDASSICPDCGQHDFKNGHFVKCLCYIGTSNPKFEKSEKNVTLTFGSDWDDQLRLSLWHSLRKLRK